MHRVLLIEDNPGDIELTRIGLAEIGLHVQLRTATSYREAMQFLHALPPDWQPDLVLLDLNLGDGSGHDLLAYMKQHTRLQEIPVAIVTTSDYPQDQARAASLGASAYVVKPNSFDHFVERLRGLTPLLAG